MNIIHAHLKVKEEYRSAFLEQVMKLLTESQAEEGNISYELYEHASQPNTFVMLEEWRDASAIAFHNQTTHFKEFGIAAKEFFQEPPRVVTYEVSPK
jgi:quinol monooxygenase YgiN